MQKVQELEAFIDSQSGPVTGYDEMLVRRLVEKVTVYDDHFTVEFKSGLETDVTMQICLAKAPGETRTLFNTT